MKNNELSSKKPNLPERGVALVLTLLVVAMLTVVVVAFNATTRTEQMAARNFSKTSGSAIYAMAADQQAVSLLARTLQQASSGWVITQPGRALVADNNANVSVVPLSSAALTNSTNLVDLNTPVWAVGTNNVRTLTNSLAPVVFLTNNGATNYFSVPWIDVQNGAGEVTGRYAFWIDDEGSRFNLNYATTNVRNSAYPTNVRPWDVSQLSFGSDQSAADARTNFLQGFALALSYSNFANQMPTWGYVFSPDQVKAFRSDALDPINRGNATEIEKRYRNSMVAWNTLQFQVAGGPGNMTNRQPLPSMGRVELGGDGFLSAGSGVAAVDGFIAEKIDTPEILRRFDEGFEDKYGEHINRQMVVNINDFFLPADGDGVVYTGSDDLLADDSSGENIPVPRAFLGVRKAPFLNEIFIGAVYFTTNAPTPDLGDVEVQFWLQSEIVDPYRSGLGEGWAVKYKVQDVSYEGTYDYRGETRSFTQPEEGEGWNFDGADKSAPIAAVPNGTKYFVPPLGFAFEFQTYFPADITNRLEVSNIIVNQVKIKASMAILRADPNDPASVRDWAFEDDFEEVTISSVPKVEESIGRGSFGPKPLPAGLTFENSIAKNDPRVRTFPSYPPPSPAWFVKSGEEVTPGAANEGVDFSVNAEGLPSDFAVESTDIYLHPSFVTNNPLSANNEPLSVFELGNVPTGLPWRTLHMHSQPAVENDKIPDWVLLDVFATPNAWVPVSTRLNPNALPYPALTNWNEMTDILEPTNRPLARVAPFMGLMSALTNSNAVTNASVSVGTLSNTVNANFPPEMVFSSNAVAQIATNIATMVFSDHWRQHPGRDNSPLFAGVYRSLAEIVEVKGISDATGVAKNIREARARVIYESMSPFSDTFSIYSIGQTLEGGTNVVGETRSRTQVKLMPNGEVRTIFSMPLLSPE